MGVLRAPSSHQLRMWCPSHIQAWSKEGDVRGGPQRDELGHGVEAGKVVRTRSLNLN